MSAIFNSTYPSWLKQPSIFSNVLHNSFAPLKDIPSILSFTDSSSFMSGLRQALFWRRRLATSATSHSVIFAFLGVGGLVSPNVSDVCRALKNVNNISRPVEVYRAFNSPFIGISFPDSTSATTFQSFCLSFNDFLVIHVTPATPDTYTFKLIGLPPLFPDHRVHHFLSKHTAIHSFSREYISIDDLSNIPLNAVIGTLKPKPDQTISQLPHIIPLPSPHLGSAMLIINGRPSLCLKCGGLGHVRRHCNSPRCTSCNRFHLPSAACSSSPSSSDPSFTNDWHLDDPPQPSTLSDSSDILFSALECNPNHELSPPKTLSSPSDPPTFANIVSSVSSINNKSASPLTNSSSRLVPVTNITMPTNLFYVPSNILEPKLNTTASTASRPIDNVHYRPSNRDEVKMAAKTTKKAALAIKRSRSCSLSSSSSKLCHSFANSFSSFEEKTIMQEGDNIAMDVVIPHNSSPSISSVTHQLFDSSHASHISSTEVILNSSTTITSPSSLNKKFKTVNTSVSASPSLAIPSSQHLNLSITKGQASSWGDRIEEEITVPHIPSSTISSSDFISSDLLSASSAPYSAVDPSAFSIPTALDNLSHPLNISSHSLLLTSSTHDVTPIQSSLNDTSSSSSEPDSLDYYDDDKFHSEASDNIICIKGLPNETSVQAIKDIFGAPYPSHIILGGGDKDHPTSYFILFLRKDIDIYHFLDKDGSWFKDHIISVSLKRAGKEDPP